MLDFTKPETFEKDIPMKAAIAAYNGTSFDPDKRGESLIRDYCQTLSSLYTELLTLADTDDKKVILSAEWERFYAGYLKRELAWISAKSRCISTMITGGSNFPVRRAERANSVEHGRSEALIEFYKKGKAAIKNKLNPVDSGIIRSGSSDAVSALKAKLDKLEKLQNLMKTANTVLRKLSKSSDQDKVAALVEAGVSEKIASELIKPSCFGTVGFERFELSNNSAEIRRLRQRLVYEERISVQETVSLKSDTTGISVEDCPSENRVRVFFPGKPASDIISALKSSGFRWTPSLGCWQAYRNNRTIDYAKSFVK